MTERQNELTAALRRSSFRRGRDRQELIAQALMLNEGLAKLTTGKLEYELLEKLFSHYLKKNLQKEGCAE